ncbi:siroheme synthase [Geomonas silvestris]|uniref:precorrin-2 dehydrogenase n=1 Tax=Geomonas silvestris TaxID=2740184 RepID=A0A6V8MI20_9BACT|nr:siroheme synthase [Geomonas silvestris]
MAAPWRRFPVDLSASLRDSGALAEYLFNSLTDFSLRYYPINLDVKDRVVVIVGGGAVAARKAARLLAAGARVTVVAPTLVPRLAELAAQGKLVHLPRPYLPGDLAGALLAFAATDAPEVNREVAEEARSLGVLVDLVADPRSGDFTTPAVLSRGELLITASTSGASPGLSRRIIEELEPLFDDEYAKSVMLLGRAREKLLTEKGRTAYNERVFAVLEALDLHRLVKNGQLEALDQILLKLSESGAAPGPEGANKKDPS